MSGLVASWAVLYADHGMLKTLVEFVHIAGLMIGGGCAIAADLSTLTAAREASAAQAVELQLVRRTHQLVVLGLVALFVSGVLLLGPTWTLLVVPHFLDEDGIDCAAPRQRWADAPQ